MNGPCTDTLPGWERRLLETWLLRAAEKRRRKADDVIARCPRQHSLHARAMLIFASRCRDAADVFARPVTEAEWPSDPKPGGAT